jgi:hypothetical protein
MKTLRTLTRGSAVVLLMTLGLSAQAGTLINNFTTPFDYVANGIIGDTNWDGMYLRFGDIPGGDIGGNPAGNTAIADSAITYPGYLSLRSSGGDWADAGDDGVLIWKLVAGDFDVSVQSSPFDLNGGTAFDNGAYQMTGLMARSYAPDNSGAPYSTTTTNAAENYVMLLRFQEYDLNEVNEAADGTRVEHTFPEGTSATDLAATRYFRMVRSSLTNFTFYWKTNQSDSWAQITSDLPGGVLVRSDLTGPLQVGIAQAPFSTGTHDAVFTDFELSGSGVIFPAMPAAPSALVTTATNTAGALKFSWTLGTPGDSSLVVMSKRPIQNNPILGITYAANAAFGTAGTLLGGAGEYVVYNGTGTSVTVTNLGANNLTYYVAVYEYSASAGPVYNTAAPATGAFPGPGVITGATLSALTNNIPVNGAVPIRLIATFSTGDTSDQTANATWGSSDTTIASVNNAGVASGVASGTATITGTFGSFSPTLNVTVHAPVFTDNFGATQNYVANGVQGTAWDGLFLNYGDVPGANKGNEGAAGQTYQLIAQTNVLFVQAAGGSWRVAGNDGPFLYKIVAGDFQASVHVTCGTINNNYAGIMARLFNSANGGGGGGAGGTETHVNWGNPQQGVPSARQTVNSGGTTVVAGLNATDRWFLMVRQNSTNFLCFEKANATDPWTAVPAATMVLAQAASNAPVEVGLFQEMRAGTVDTAQFDTLMIDGPGIVSPAGTPAPPAASGLTATLNADLTITFSWVATNSAGQPVASILVMRAGGPITAQPTYGLAPGYGGAFGTGVSLGDGNYVVARSSTSPNTVTVTGLTPGTTYYAAVYTFGGTYPDRVYNNVLPATGATGNLLDGVLQSVTVFPVASIPLGGLQIPLVIGVFGGNPVNVSAFAAWTIADTNIVQMAPGSGVVSGMAVGSTTAVVVYGGVTNTVALTVRAPTFKENFSVDHDYLANGVTGTTWDGVYRQGVDTNEVPNSEFVPGAGEGTTLADANVSSNNVLTITAAGSGWEENNAGGFFLFKYVPGDFQAAVHINSYDIAGYNQPGLLARAYGTGTNGTTLGAPFVIGPLRTNVSDQSGTVIVNTFGESWVSLTRFDEFNIGTYVRLNLDSAVHQSTQTDQDDNNFWLLIHRSNGTDFHFFKKLNATDPWKPVPNNTVYNVSEFAGVPMQVGLMSGPWSGTTSLTVMFENFMLDRTTGSPLSISQAGTNVNLTWPPIPGTLQYSLGVSPANWQPVTGVTPVLTKDGYMVTLPITAAPWYFRLVQ